MTEAVRSWPTLVEVDDPRLAPLRNLPDRAPTEHDPLVIEGAIAVQRALGGPVRVHSVFGTATQLTRLGACVAGAEAVFTVDAALLRAVMGFPFHRGVVALAQRPPAMPTTVPSVLQRSRWTELMLERLADPANVGAVIRTAAALGVDLVVCDEQGADPYGRRALRASMGHALVRNPWVADLRQAATQLADAGARVIAATTEPDACPLPELQRADRTVLALGNEGDGLSAPLRGLAHQAVTIPIDDAADSLNVAAAAAIFTYALRRS